MKEYKGNILAHLNEKTKDNIVANKHYAIELISAYDIIPNEANFYTITNIESLAAKMALSNHVSPLEVVQRKDGKYTLISGERRRAAVLLRYEAGEIPSPDVPCFVRSDFSGNGKLTAKQMEIINIICANEYRKKTPFEELDEVLKLKPIAKIFYDEERENGLREDFRVFFATKFLGIAPSSLQRILVLEKLVDEAREVYAKTNISKSVLSELAYKREEIQREFLEKILDGQFMGTVQEIKAFAFQKGAKSNIVRHKKTDDDAEKNTEIKDDAEITDNSNEEIEKVEEVEENNELGSDHLSEEPQEENFSDNMDAEPYEETPEEPYENFSDDEKIEEKTEELEEAKSESVSKADAKLKVEVPNVSVSKPQIQVSSAKSPKIISPDDAKKEAELWVQNGIERMIQEAEVMKKEAEENGDSKNAAMWDLRRAAANLVLENIK